MKCSVQGGETSNYNLQEQIDNFALYQISCFLFLFQLKGLCFSSAFGYAQSLQICIFF